MPLFPPNYVRLEGELDRLKFSVTATGTSILKGCVRVPQDVTDSEGTRKLYFDSVHIVAFGDTADALSEVGKGGWVIVEGNIETSKYTKNCHVCHADGMAYWTEVKISNFTNPPRPPLNADYVYE